MLSRISSALGAIVAGGAIGTMGLGGCAPGPMDDRAWPEPRPLARDLSAFRPSPKPAEATTPAALEPTGELSLRDALAASLMGSPHLAAAGYDVRAQEAAALQAGVMPNPELAIEFENFGGSDEFEGTDALESTLVLSQVIELGGKRTKRQRAAQHQARLAGWDYEISRIDVLSKTAADFVGLLAAKRKLEIASQAKTLAERVFHVVGERVEAGKVSPVERTKAMVELAKVVLAYEQSQLAAEFARYRLASNWGSTDPQFESIAGDLDQTTPPATLEWLLERVEQNPDLARWAAAASLREAEIDLALAQRTSDVSVSGGIRHMNDLDDTVFVAGVSLPLPIFNRNQQGIRAARLRALEGGQLEEAARIQTRIAIVEASLKLDGAYLSVNATRDQILPGAQRAFDAAEEAFVNGKIGALDLLDAERTLFEAQEQLLDSLVAYHLAVVAGERLIGDSLYNENQTQGDDR